METYVILGNFTEQGVKNIKDLAARVEDAKAATEGAGGQWVGYWLTMGRYDFVAITMGPSGNIAATQLLANALLGNTRTETMRAFTFEEAKDIVANIP